MKENFEIVSQKNIEDAKKIINELEIVETCAKFDCTANLVGSVATGLLVNRFDIDFHIYPRDFCVSKIYNLIGKIAEKSGITSSICYNFLETEYKSLDWHLTFQATQNRSWQIDMIFIKSDSKYVGRAEQIVKTLQENMTEAQKKTILQLKWEADKQQMEHAGIEIYKAVIESQVAILDEFVAWKKANEKPDLWEIKV